MVAPKTQQENIFQGGSHHFTTRAKRVTAKTQSKRMFVQRIMSERVRGEVSLL
jgi:hypothetical protein